MITVISGTNRKNNRTLLIAQAFVAALQQAGQAVQLLDLTELELSAFSGEMYHKEGITPRLQALQEQYILSADKLAFFVPEYNGSYPGIVKLFIDGISVNAYARNFMGKKIALVGVASGRAGNLRGMDHLGSALAYMGAWILPNKLPVSNVEKLIAPTGEVTDTPTLVALTQLAQQLIDA